MKKAIRDQDASSPPNRSRPARHRARTQRSASPAEIHGDDHETRAGRREPQIQV